MPYSQSLAERVRQSLRNQGGIAEKKMFGGVGFLLHGNMLVGVWQQSLVVRLGPEQALTALKRAHVSEFDVTGRPMKSWIMIDPDSLDSDIELAEWIEAATKFVETAAPQVRPMGVPRASRGKSHQHYRTGCVSTISRGSIVCCEFENACTGSSSGSTSGRA